MGKRPTRGDKATITPEFVNRVERFSKGTDITYPLISDGARF